MRIFDSNIPKNVNQIPKMVYTPPSPGVNVTEPLIYMWEIADSSGQVIGRYVGKANGGETRPRQHYSRNVEKLLAGRPYKKDKEYRRVHFALADAVKAKHNISLHYLCNVSDDENIFKVESQYIRKYNCNVRDGLGLNGPWTESERAMLRLRVKSGASAPALPDYPPIKQTLPDLEDFLEIVQDHYPGPFRITWGVHRYSLWLGNHRIIRAEQSGPRGKVRVKLAQSSIGKKAVKFGWDGSEIKLSMLLKRN